VQIFFEETVTFCISIRNSGPRLATGVAIADIQAPNGGFDIGVLDVGQEETRSYTATASGNGPNGPLPEPSDTALISNDPQPDPILEIVKTVLPGPDAACPAFDDGVSGDGAPLQRLFGDVATYCITVRNTGANPATNVAIADDQAPNGGFAIGDLAVDEEQTRSYDVTITADTPSRNTATASGTGPNGALPQPSDTALVNNDPQPDPVLEIVKTVLQGPAASCGTFADGVAGDGTPLPLLYDDVATFCISIRNSGERPATDVVISDVQAPNGGFTIGTLDVGEEDTVSYDVTITADTPVRNTATASGNGPNGPVPEPEDTAVIDNDPQPDPVLEIVKTVVALGDACPAFAEGTAGDGNELIVTYGDTVTFCISVRNTGERPATDVVISDAQAPGGSLTVGTLDVGQEQTVSYNVAVSADTPVRNTATASGNGPNGPLPEPADTAVIAPGDPILEIVKTVVLGPNGDCPTFAEGVQGEGPALEVLFDDVATYCISVRNTGLNAATDVVINDTQAPGGSIAVGTLAINEEQTRSYDVTILEGTPTRNTATASGNGPNGPLPEPEDVAVIDNNPQPDPRLEIVKTVVAAGTACPAFADGVSGDGDALVVTYGDTVTFCVAVRNTGERPATDVVVSDAQAPGGSLTIGTLDVGQEETVSYDVVVAATTPPQNTATASGNGPNGPLPEPTDTSIITPGDPILEVVKSVVEGPNGTCPATFDEGVSGAGDPLDVQYTEFVTYCITVRNSGLNAATEVRINDTQAPDGGFDIGTLDVGAEQSRSYDVEIDADTPPNNTATATGSGPNGPVPEATDPAVINPAPLPDPVLEIVKTAIKGANAVCPSFDDGIAGAGTAVDVMYTETITYCLTVKNTGEFDATNVVISDDQAPQTYEIGALPVGEERTRSYEVVVDENTPPNNLATASGNGPNGPLPEPSDPAVIDPSPLPDPVLEVVKTVLEGPAATCPAFDAGVAGNGDAVKLLAGDTATYCISVRNTGAGTATGVTISDDQAPDGGFDIGELGPNQGQTVTYDVLITDTTPVTNVAVVNGNGPNGPTPQVEDPAVIDTRSVSISLIHSVSKANEDCLTAAKNLNSLVANRIDLEITWCAEVANTGNVPLTQVELIAPNIGDGEVIAVTTGTEVILPGDSVFVPVTGTIPEDGLVSGALASGMPSDELGNVVTDLPEVSDVDNAEVREASIDLETTVVAGKDGDCTQATEVVEVLPGADITWCFVATNTGAIDLEVERISDDVLGVSVDVPADEQIFRVGATIVLQTNATADAEVTINADIQGDPLDFDGTPLEAPPVDDVDPAQILIAEADLSIVKSVSDAGPTTINTPLTYTLVVANAGPDAARNVVVTDSLPVGLEYLTLPVNDDWSCALDADAAGFRCVKATDLAADGEVTLTYTARTTIAAPAGADLVNTVRVTSDTPDPDPTDNVDTEVTKTPDPAPEVIPRTEGPLPYPGPFTLPEPPTPPDEVLGLAITGAMSNLMVLLSAAMVSVGGVLAVGARRAREDEDE